MARRLVADGVPQRQVARDMGIGRSTVARALACDRPPKYERPAVPTAFTLFDPLVREPVFEADFHSSSYGFRSRRRAWDAVAEVQLFASRSYERVCEGDITACVDELDKALAETINDLYKTELVKPRGPWRTLDSVEITTAEWVDWFNPPPPVDCSPTDASTVPRPWPRGDYGRTTDGS